MQDTYNYISPGTLENMINHIPELHIRKWADNDIRMLFRIMYHCALRPSEAIKIEKAHIDLSRREIYLGKTKTKQNDKCVIPRDILDDIGMWLPAKPKGRLWPNLRYNTLYKWLIRLGNICEITALQSSQEQTGEKTKGHIFRKSMGKEMFYGSYGEGATKINEIAKHLRHSKPSTTMDHYLKLSLESVKDVL